MAGRGEGAGVVRVQDDGRLAAAQTRRCWWRRLANAPASEVSKRSADVGSSASVTPITECGASVPSTVTVDCSASVAAARVQRRERALLLVFGEAERELPGMAEQRHVGRTAPATADVDHGQAKGPADRGVGAMAGTERPEPAVDAAAGLAGRPVDDDQRADGSGSSPAPR